VAQNPRTLSTLIVFTALNFAGLSADARPQKLRVYEESVAQQLVSPSPFHLFAFSP
jgi:hypothetical protein